MAVGHNGNLTNTRELMLLAQEKYGADLRGELGRGSSTDTAVITTLLRDEPDARNRACSADALRVLPILKGAFSLAFIDETTLYAARDRYGLRPLVLGRLGQPGGRRVRVRCARHRRRRPRA